jgi:hypothetical protein
MTLLSTTLEVLRHRLDAAFQIADPRSEEWVTLTSPIDLDGRVSERARNKIVMVLAGLHSEKTAGGHAGPVPVRGDQYAMMAAPLNLNLSLLFVANFGDGNYATGLGMLSRVIAFFQENPVFTAEQLPGLADDVDRLALDFVSLDLMQTNYLMGMLGLKYLPSAMYRVRTLQFAGAAFTGLVPQVRAPDSGLPKS